MEEQYLFCLNVSVYIKPERRDEFLLAVKQNAIGTLTTEPLNRLYTWGESTTEPNTFHFQEQFVGEAGFEEHKKTAHFAVWLEFANDADSPFSKPPIFFSFRSALSK